ncbi:MULTISPECIES: hypothetical protein [unclassified Treponema]|uniref:dual OB domain-containing protein n=1 Tax=unclassified Treponema TaxID=2638727 RepID=UPI0020A24833|nr:MULTISPECIES: hypothetical protein [unclassified Treponema]UTC68208.1 hypothetical protein E4O06_06130 [Treponema sp. OMZ 789]UTC70928.1 hypothetical protein E4O01_06275 [Treponema sp. OMZ 790]UTC73668.1 hypothetical protein E4O02_06470 [Treponema sp. OMZ 791]
MGTDFLVVANSIKSGGRCLAGILNPYSDKKKWCRLVADPSGKQLDNDLPITGKDTLSKLTTLDIIEVTIALEVPLPEQPENMLLDKTLDIKYVKQENKTFLNQFLQTPDDIWGRNSISEPTHNGSSLMLLQVDNPKISKTFKDYPSLEFEYKNTSYNIRCTMENFVYIPLNSNLKTCLICVSSGVQYNGSYYKFVANVII